MKSAPSFESRLHRRSGNGLIKEAQRGLIGLRFSRHVRLPRESRTFEAGEQRGRSGKYLDATGLSKGPLREPAAEHSDGRNLGLSGCFGIVWCISDRDGVGTFDVQLLEHGLEYVRRGFRFLGIIGRRRQIY